MQKVAEALADQLGIAPKELLGCFLWPLASRRDTLEGLFRLGTKGGPIFSLASTIAAQLQAKFDSDVLLETMMLSEPIHVAHAIDATSFGTIDEPPLFHALKSVVSKHLNFHRCFNLSLAESWMDNETRDVNRDALVPAVPMFEFEAAIPIGEILEGHRAAVDTIQRSRPLCSSYRACSRRTPSRNRSIKLRPEGVDTSLEIDSVGCRQYWHIGSRILWCSVSSNIWSWDSRTADTREAAPHSCGR